MISDVEFTYAIKSTVSTKTSKKCGADPGFNGYLSSTVDLEG